MPKNMNRRKFIKKAGAAAATAITAPYFVPGSVLAKNGGVAPSNRITMGFIGVGGIGIVKLQGFLENSDAHVLAACDVDTQHRNIARDIINEKYGNKDCATYNDFRELIIRKDIDAIFYAVPDHWHALIAIMAARQGKDIYGEKPLAYNIAEGRAIVDAVNKYGIVFQTGTQQRSDRNFRYACELVRNGRIGKVHTVRVGLPQGNLHTNKDTNITQVPKGFDYDRWLGPAPWAPYCEARCHVNFRWISDYSAGQITDWGGHHLDIAQWGMNTEHTSPVEIEGKAVFARAIEGLYDTASEFRFVCKYREGFRMIVSTTTQHAKKVKYPKKGRGVFFEGTEGWIFVNRYCLYAKPVSVLKSVISPNEVHLYKSKDHYQNFLDCVKTRKKTVAPAEIAHRSVMIGYLGLIAMKLGRKVNWNPEKERFVNDPEADRMLSRPMRSPYFL